MGMHGRKVRVNGLVCGLILREAGNTGGYELVFERENATLEQLEAVDWTRPEMEYLSGYSGTKLPEGYGYELVNMAYHHNDKTWRVRLAVGTQYYGDVTGYQEQVAQLEAAAAEREETIASQSAEIEAKSAEIAARDEIIANRNAEIEAKSAEITARDETITNQIAVIEAQNGTITEQSAEIEALKEAGTAAELEEGLDAAYQEGVDSVE